MFSTVLLNILPFVTLTFFNMNILKIIQNRGNMLAAMNRRQVKIFEVFPIKNNNKNKNILISVNLQRREMTITLTMRMIVAAFLLCHSLKLGLNCYEIANIFMGDLN